MSEPTKPTEDSAIQRIQAELADLAPSTRRRVFEAFALAALGSIPWVGGFLSAIASFKTEEGDLRANDLQTQWLREHHNKMERLALQLNEIALRFESLGEQLDDRIQSDAYLDLVRRAFRAWDRAETDDKRRYVGNLVANAGGTRICSDDVVRLFIDWLDHYHESHFAVVREVFQHPGATRARIWEVIHDDFPREDFAEADLFRLLIRDLSTGGVIRQERDTNVAGQFLRRRSTRRRGSAPTTMESAFEDEKPYVPTELGKQFFHYTMNEVVARIDGSPHT